MGAVILLDIHKQEYKSNKFYKNLRKWPLCRMWPKVLLPKVFTQDEVPLKVCKTSFKRPLTVLGFNFNCYQNNINTKTNQNNCYRKRWLSTKVDVSGQAKSTALVKKHINTEKLRKIDWAKKYIIESLFINTFCQKSNQDWAQDWVQNVFKDLNLTDSVLFCLRNSDLKTLAVKKDKVQKGKRNL